ncbi:MAG: RHS repeat-associated core domain-containing protein [Bacteroidales bacterium]|nr:RHS repeat-associated core domain-containing protein [Bacteroidales bacterium]
MTNNSGTFTPQFNITDHLGNVRSVVNSGGAVLQSTDYYPFGLAFADNNVATNRYLFNGKELENYTLGTTYLGTLDYGARHYDPRIARWTVPDPMAEKYYGISGYVYCAGNPVMLVDPVGRFPVLLVPLIKGAVGAIADAAAQVTVSMVNGQSFGQAMSSIDYTSVGASFVTAAIAMPGMSTAAKVATVAVVATDAAIDVNAKGEIQTIGGVIGENKSITNAAIDAVSSVVPGKVVDNVTSGFNKAVSSDLGSSAAATLTKETKSSMKQAQAMVNSTAVQTGANAVADYMGGMIGGQANEAIGTGSTTRISTPLKDSLVQQNDATRVQRPIIPIYSR